MVTDLVLLTERPPLIQMASVPMVKDQHIGRILEQRFDGRVRVREGGYTVIALRESGRHRLLQLSLVAQDRDGEHVSAELRDGPYDDPMIRVMNQYTTTYPLRGFPKPAPSLSILNPWRTIPRTGTRMNRPLPRSSLAPRSPTASSSHPARTTSFLFP